EFVELCSKELEDMCSTGSVKSHQIRLTLTITVDDIDFDPQGGLLRIKGCNIAENKY
ncbi:26636_t:CDS:2, partial [Gigaspora margarita]